MYRCLLLFGVALLLSGCCDADCYQRQRTEKELDKVRTGWSSSLMDPHPELLRDFASEESAERIKFIWFTDDVSSPHFAALANFPNLKHIDLYCTTGTDGLLKHLVGAKKLAIIDTDSTDISDVGLESVSQMPSLVKLIIFGTRGKITVEGIKKLSSVKTLKTLDPNIELNEAEEKEIREALPNVSLIEE